jgi:hypothetical protein
MPPSSMRSIARGVAAPVKLLGRSITAPYRYYQKAQIQRQQRLMSMQRAMQYSTFIPNDVDVRMLVHAIEQQRARPWPRDPYSGFPTLTSNDVIAQLDAYDKRPVHVHRGEKWTRKAMKYGTALGALGALGVGAYTAYDNPHLVANIASNTATFTGQAIQNGLNTGGFALRTAGRLLPW